MSIGKSLHPGHIPNWLDHEWAPASRLHWLRVILTLSSRDWSQYPYATPGADDPESWAIYCLVTCDDRATARLHWGQFCFPERTAGAS